MPRTILFPLLGACLLSSIAQAEDTKISVHVSGVGASTCAHWRSSAATRAEGTIWIFGFWTGLNYVAAASEQAQPKFTEKEAIAEVAKVCMTDPSQLLAGAAWTAYLNISQK